MTRRYALTAVTLALLNACAGVAAAQGPDRTGGRRVQLRLVADSGVVGHFRFTGQLTSRLVFDIPEDDPRHDLLAAVTAPQSTTRDVAGTVVSTPAAADEDRRYLIYWLGYRFSGEEDRTLSPVAWDSIFQKVGRRATLRFSPLGRPLGVQVSSDAVRPVARSLADILAGLAMALPADSVGLGGRWEGQVAVPITAPDGSRQEALVQVTYRLAEVSREPDGVRARIEFDGEPVGVSIGVRTVSGEYFGESVFSVSGGYYEEMMALANLEVNWEDTSGLPPSRTVIEWRGQLIRR
ncbi:MAG: hypothetical protein GWN99_14765 [Gemmatimonadetes bacterium]|uniref:GerMN domain-containing protein n=1 Tax=Candidatus Kutchimonas denitrificans TaxID=3056748 RepID=A0AAE4ZDD7_9BACT|nr:hypothetical protein [Gemmatimonadota bacterium]NIR76285.1 hypothetical protein [Candidatus Kutchimonas denitrificans]NIS02308.1 hypothetical protein [Gemmatimonadota bacterium]NIT68127.1 hypothetical protein [Gemmatimonadota bacterium]NIU54351.1 hypothetical protein [Gemmatimonadota bacterium]